MPKVHTLSNGDTFYKDDKLGDKIVKPGETIVLPEKGGFIYPGVLQGTPENPIRIVPHPKGGTLTAGIDLRDPQNVIIECGGKLSIDSGKGATDRTKIPDSVGIHIYGKAENVKISGVVFKNVGIGIKAKNEPSCDKDLQAWVIKNIGISDCTFENILWEALYFGSTDLGGKRAQLNCPGDDSPRMVEPPRLGSFRILNNSFKKTGRAAIQVSLSSEGMTEIAHNTIEEAGLEKSTEQGNGINIGGLSKVYIHHNKINKTFTSGIASLGGIEVVVQENKIDNSGHLFPDKPVAWAWGILVVTRPTNPERKTSFIIQDNVIGLRGQGGPEDKGWPDIFIGDDVADGSRFQETGNIVSGNTSAVTKAPAIIKLKQDKIKYTDKAVIPPPAVEVPAETSQVAYEFIVQFMKDGTMRWKAK